MIDINKNKAFYNAMRYAAKNPSNTGVDTSQCTEEELKVFYAIQGKSNLVPTFVTKLFSYCDDFTEEEQDILQENQGCDCYIEFTANTKFNLEARNYSNCIIANKLIELGCVEDEKVLIHLNW